LAFLAGLHPPKIFVSLGFLPVAPFGFFNNFLNLPNFRKLGSQLHEHAQHSQQVEQQQVEQSQAVQQVVQSELHGAQQEGVQHEGIQHDVGAQHAVGAQQGMQETQQNPQEKHPTSHDKAQVIESNALVHP
jgi:hypothetical protein